MGRFGFVKGLSVRVCVHAFMLGDGCVCMTTCLVTVALVAKFHPVFYDDDRWWRF